MIIGALLKMKNLHVVKQHNKEINTMNIIAKNLKGGG